MASIRDYAVTEYGAATTASLVCNMPVHEANDILIFFASKDGNPVINDPSWTNIQDGASAGMAYRSQWKLAASAAETLTLTTGTAENFTVVVVSIKDANTSSPISASAESGSDDTAMPFAGPSTDTGTDTNCLILHAWFSDTGLSPTAYAPLINIYAGDNGANSTGVAYTYQKAAGAVAAGSWYGRANDDGRGIVVAVKDSGTEVTVPAYSDPAITVGQVLRPMVGLGTMFSDTWPTSLSIAVVGDDWDAAYTDVGPGVFTSILTNLNSAATADVTFPTANTDFVYFGSDDRFRKLLFNVSTAGVTGTITWEYYSAGGAWTSAGVTQNLTSTGVQIVDLGWTIRNAMAQTSVNSVTKYWVRANIATAYSGGAITVSQGRKDGQTATYIVASAAADGGTNPYTDACQNAGSSSTAACSGPQINFGASLDLDTGILFGTIRPVLPRDFALDIAEYNHGAGGVQVTLLDASGYYASYIIGAAKCNNLDLDGRSVYAIDWNGSATAWALRGSVAKGSVTQAWFSTFGYGGAAAVQWSMFSLVSLLGIAGGSSGTPLDIDDIAYVANNGFGIFPFIKKTGGSVLIWVPLQIGGGSPVFVYCNLNTFQFPTRYNGTTEFGWNAAVDVAGIKFYPKSGDVVKFTNCVFTSESQYRWEFDSSSASSGWTGDFSGTTVVNANVTLRDVFTFNLMTFVNCGTFTQNGATITNGKFTNTKVTSSSPANAAKISSTTFTSSGTGYAIEIGGTAADCTLTGLTFTGYASSDGSTGNEAIYVNIATGTMTITIAGGGSTPSVRTAGATVTVVNSRILTLSGLVSGSDIVILNAGTTTELVNVNENSGTTYQYSYAAGSAGTSVDIGVFKANYVPFYIRAYTLLSSDATLPISQISDRNYVD